MLYVYRVIMEILAIFYGGLSPLVCQKTSKVRIIFIKSERERAINLITFIYAYIHIGRSFSINFSIINTKIAKW